MTTSHTPQTSSDEDTGHKHIWTPAHSFYDDRFTAYVRGHLALLHLLCHLRCVHATLGCLPMASSTVFWVSRYTSKSGIVGDRAQWAMFKVVFYVRSTTALLRGASCQVLIWVLYGGGGAQSATDRHTVQTHKLITFREWVIMLLLLLI